MQAIRGVYEVVVRVRDLAKAEAFYCDVLGLEVGLRDPRGMLFLRAGGQAGMVVLQEERERDFPKQHFAFRSHEEDLEEAAKVLAERGVVTVGPIHHAWMPARSLYFEDPDGHDLELCAPLP